MTSAFADDGRTPRVSRTAAIGQAAIELADVRFSYSKDAPFMKGLSARFAHGRVTSIVGPNGCGKSTMVKLIDGIVRPFGGRILVEGEDVANMGHKQRARKLAVLAQSTRPPVMTVEALVACGRYPHLERQGRLGPRDRELVEEAMELAGVKRFRSCDLRQLSGGERQRAFIAMTLAQDTGIILLDEPTTFLDIGACHELMELVCRLNVERGKTIAMVIHDLDLALRYSHELVVMERGRITCAGSVGEVLAAEAINRAFGVTIQTHEGPLGKSHAIFPARR